MKTILKKSLALAVCVALCLTAFIGCLTVSATGTATAVISTVNVANGTTNANVTVTVTGSQNVAGFRIDIVADATEVTIGTVADGTGYSVEKSSPATNTTRFVVLADNVSTGLASVTLTLPCTILDPTAAGTIDIEGGEVAEIAGIDETLMATTWTDGGIVVAAAHVHDFSGSWQSNANYHWKVCPADDTVGEQAAHTFGGWTTTVQPGCTTTGTKTRTCSVCGYVESDTVAANGHTPAAAVQENVVPATCNTAGSYDSVVYCSVCETEISRTTGVVIPATGEHTAAAAVQENVVAATCGAAGSYDSVVYCSVCNAEISRTTGNVIPATGAHTWGAYTYDAEGHSRTCSVCSAVDAGAHVGNPCSVCGYEASAPSCEHENLTPVGISGGNFVFTCDDCDEEVLIPVASEVYGSNTGVSNSIMPTNDISLFFYFRQDRTSAFTNLVLKAEKTDYYTDTTKTYYIADEGLVDIGRPDGILCHQFTFSDLAAYEMGTTVTGTLYGLTSGGEMMQLKVATYSVLSYVNTILDGSYPAGLKKTLVDMLNYGSYCQVYGNYNTDNLVNAGLTSAQQAMATPVGEYPDAETAFVTTTGLGLALSRPDQTTAAGRVSCPRAVYPGAKAFIEYMIAPKGGDINNFYASFDYYDVNGNATSTDVFSYSEKGLIFQGSTSFQFDLAPISTLTYPVTMHLYYGDPDVDGVEVLTAPYSIESYISTVLTDPVTYSDVNLQNLLKSMYAFGHSLAAYAGIDDYSI